MSSTITGRTRAKSNPFWATAITQMLPGPRAVVTGLHHLIGRSPLLAPWLWIGSGWRTGSTEHSSGRAVDIIVTADTGRVPTDDEHAAALALIDWLIAHATQIGLTGIIYSRDRRRRPEVWGYSQPGKWRAQPPRGSVSADHVDHIHLYLAPSASWPAALANTIIGGTPTPAPKPTPAPAPAVPKIPPYPVGIGPGKSRPSAHELQAQLQKTGFMPASVQRADNYGPQTQTAVAKFHDRYPAYRSAGMKRDVRIGPKGWAKLWSLT